MSNPEHHQSGPFDARYLAFLETIAQLRPSLHRYCARMTGSVLDGEDVVQEALFESYRKLEKFDERRPLRPWLFRIAHNRCIDFLRKRKVRIEADAAATSPDSVGASESAALDLDAALEHLVIALPPMERACVLLKDVFDYSLEEIAGLVDSSLGGVKAALHRGRSKISAPQAVKSQTTRDPAVLALLALYVERFNNRDWHGMRDLISADARLEVVARYAGRLADSPYFGRYEEWPAPLELAVGEVDGELMLLVLEWADGVWGPRAPVRLEIVGQRIERITDYFFCPWILDAATSVHVAQSPPAQAPRKYSAPP